MNLQVEQLLKADQQDLASIAPFGRTIRHTASLRRRHHQRRPLRTGAVGGSHRQRGPVWRHRRRVDGSGAL